MAASSAALVADIADELIGAAADFGAQAEQAACRVHRDCADARLLERRLVCLLSAEPMSSSYRSCLNRSELAGGLVPVPDAAVAEAAMALTLARGVAATLGPLRREYDDLAAKTRSRWFRRSSQPATRLARKRTAAGSCRPGAACSARRRSSAGRSPSWHGPRHGPGPATRWLGAGPGGDAAGGRPARPPGGPRPSRAWIVHRGDMALSRLAATDRATGRHIILGATSRAAVGAGGRTG